MIVAFVGAGGRAQHAVFDGAGPIVDGVSIPGQGALGEQQQFMVRSARDAWSPMGQLTWLFSDGLSATGASVGHVFGEPGTQSARLRATDALGNRTTVTGTVEVPAAPAAPASPRPLRHRPPPRVMRPRRSSPPSPGAQRSAPVRPVRAGYRRRGHHAQGHGRAPRQALRRASTAQTRRATCTRQLAVATVRATFKPGAAKLTLPKKARRTKGTYTIALTVRDAAGNVYAHADDLPGLLGLAMNVTHSLHLEPRFDGAAAVGHVRLAVVNACVPRQGRLVSAVDDPVPRDRQPRPVGEPHEQLDRHRSDCRGRPAAVVAFPATAFGVDALAAKVLCIDPLTGA